MCVCASLSRSRGKEEEGEEDERWSSFPKFARQANDKQKKKKKKMSHGGRSKHRVSLSSGHTFTSLVEMLKVLRSTRDGLWADLNGAESGSVSVLDEGRTRTAFRLFRAALSRHHDPARKVGSGVSSFVIHDQGGGRLCVSVCRTDGSLESFSLPACCKGDLALARAKQKKRARDDEDGDEASTHHQLTTPPAQKKKAKTMKTSNHGLTGYRGDTDHLREALRLAVKGQKDAFKQEMKEIGDLVCAARHCTAKGDALEVDHIFTHATFAQIKNEFLASTPTGNIPTIFKRYANNSAKFRECDGAFTARWQEFHQARAMFRMLCKTHNLRER